jgi:hypothetical protein
MQFDPKHPFVYDPCLPMPAFRDPIYGLFKGEEESEWMEMALLV